MVEGEQSAEARKQELLMRRDAARESATETQQQVSEIQSAKYETMLLNMMQRTNTNPEIVNALNDLVQSLDSASHFGESDNPMPDGHLQVLAEAIHAATKSIQDRR